MQETEMESENTSGGVVNTTPQNSRLLLLPVLEGLLALEIHLLRAPLHLLAIAI